MVETPSSGRTRKTASLAEAVAAPDYAARASEAIQRILGAADPFEALSLLEQASRRVGADAAAFVSFIRNDPSHESYRFLLACDPVWCLEYEQRAWYANDPWLQYALGRSEPVRASEIVVESGQQRALVDLSKRFGFRSAVVVPAPSSGGHSRVGVLCLGSEIEGYFEGDGFTALKVFARSLAMELHEWWVGQVKRELVSRARISADDLELLRQERLGHSTKQIAAELETTPNSVNSRFQRINAKLDVPNRKAAARLATEYGLI